jgi:hypothetical protein
MYARIQQEDESEEEEEEVGGTRYLPTRQKGMKKKIVVTSLVILLAVIIKPNLACSAVTTLTAEETACRATADGTLKCTVNQVTQLSMVPSGQEACLILKNARDEAMGSLSIEIGQVVLKCQPKNEFFSRSFEMKVASSRRCPGAGSCTGEKCAAVLKDTKVAELNGEPNERPGHTFCAATPACIANSCFYCTSSCLFYRTYATPSSETTFEIFTCPIWSWSTKVTLRLSQQNETITQTFELEFGKQLTWNNMRLTLISVSEPPLPILHSKWITDGTRVARIEAADSGQPLAGTFGSLQCGNRQAAEKFECILAPNLCQCNPTDEKAVCTCSSQSLERLFENPERLLPLTMETITLSGQGTKVEAEVQQNLGLEMQISLEGLKLQKKIDQSKCTITPRTLTGCYSCLGAAKLSYECKSDFSSQLAFVRCGEAAFTAACSADGRKGIVTMSFSTAVVDAVCVVQCSAGTTTFALKGTLVFVNKEQLSNINSIISNNFEKTDADFDFLARFISGEWKIVLTTIVVVIVCVLLSIICVPPMITLVGTQLFACTAKKRN